MKKSTKHRPFFIERLIETGVIIEPIKRRPFFISEKLIEVEVMAEPNYTNWLARKKWTILEASCLFHGIDLYVFENLNEEFAADDPSSRVVSDQELLVVREVLSLITDIRRKSEVMLTWLPKDRRGKPADDVTEPGTEAEEDPLKLINTHLLTIGNIPKKL